MVCGKNKGSGRSYSRQAAVSCRPLFATILVWSSQRGSLPRKLQISLFQIRRDVRNLALTLAATKRRSKRHRKARNSERDRKIVRSVARTTSRRFVTAREPLRVPTRWVKF